MIILHALEGISVLFLLGLVGYGMAWKKWLPREATTVLPKIIVTVAFPPYLIYMMIESFNREDLIHAFNSCVIPLASMIITWVIGYSLALVFNVRKSRRGLMGVGFSTSNTVFMGIPINIAVFGSHAMPAVLVYFICNNIFFWTVGNYSIVKEGEGCTQKFLSTTTLKQIFSPPLLASITGVILVWFSIPLPHFLISTAKYLGGLPTPLAMFFIGMMFFHMKLSKVEVSRELLLLIVGRLIISPIVMIGLLYFFPVPKMMHDVFIMQSSLPIMTNVAILAGLYKSDPEFAAMAVMVTTLLSLITTPVIVALLTYFP